MTIAIEGEDFDEAHNWEFAKYYTGNSARTAKPYLDSNLLKLTLSRSELWYVNGILGNKVSV